MSGFNYYKWGQRIFQLLVDTKMDNSTLKRDFSTIYYQQEAILNDFERNAVFSGEKSNYYQIGNDYFQFQKTLTKKVVISKMMIKEPLDW